MGIKFHTPEEFFLGEVPRPFTRPFKPSEYLTNSAGAEGQCVRTLFEGQQLILVQNPTLTPNEMNVRSYYSVAARAQGSLRSTGNS